MSIVVVVGIVVVVVGIVVVVVVATNGKVEMVQDLCMHIEIKCRRLLPLSPLLFLRIRLFVSRLQLHHLLRLTTLQDGRHCVISKADQCSIRYGCR